MELVKTRAYNHDNKYTNKEQEAAWYTLHKCLESMLKLIAPICPFVTEKIYQTLYDSKKSIHLELFPEPQDHWKTALTELTPIILEVNSSIWKIKKDNKLALRDQLDLVYMPKEMKPLKRDLQHAHNINNLNFGSSSDENMLNIKKAASEVYARIK